MRQKIDAKSVLGETFLTFLFAARTSFSRLIAIFDIVWPSAPKRCQVRRSRRSL